MKKIAWLFVLLVMLLVFAACTGEPDSNKEDATKTPAAQTLTPSPTPKPTLSEEDIETRERYDELISIAIKADRYT